MASAFGSFGSAIKRQATAAVRQSLLREFRQTDLGKTLLTADSQIRRGMFRQSQAARLRRSLRSMTTQAIADQLGQFLLGPGESPETERYAKGNLLEKALGARGPLGRLLGKLLSPLRREGKVDTERELEVAANLLKSFGYTVLPPTKAPPRRTPEQKPSVDEGITTGRLKPLPGWQWPAREAPRPAPHRGLEEFREAERRERAELLTGDMTPVTSSNVHSIGFRLDHERQMGARQGTLLIRFLGTNADGTRSGPGPLYEYYDVPARVFLAFKRAASKGKFVWDNVRMRGTVSGHRYEYDLAEISQDYVPRQAGIKRGQQGEWYLTRKFRDRRTGKLHVSQLPEEQVRRTGPNRGLRGNELRHRPGRGR
jgi:hypothetical protein